MNNRESGASLAEFLVAAPLVLLIGLATLQVGLIYHGKTTLNYAVFEAARVGAVSNAQIDAIREELGLRLAPVQGGDATQEKLLQSIVNSTADVHDVENAQIKVLNPSREAFDDWGVMSRKANRRVLPNVHLRHKSDELGSTSGVTIQDANLLKIRVVYGLEMKVPIVGKLFSEAMGRIDTENARFYQRKKFPLAAVATVRMQSEAWEDEVLSSLVPTVVPDASNSNTDEPQAEQSDNEVRADDAVVSNDTPNDTPNVECEGGEYGLGAVSELIDTSDYLDQQCAISSQAYMPAPGSESSISDQADCA